MADFELAGDFKIDQIDFANLSKSAFDAANVMANKIERLCEKARAMGADVCLVVAPMRQNAQTFGYEIPYRFIKAGDPVEHECQIYGPWPAP